MKKMKYNLTFSVTKEVVFFSSYMISQTMLKESLLELYRLRKKDRNRHQIDVVNTLPQGSHSYLTGHSPRHIAALLGAPMTVTGQFRLEFCVNAMIYS